MTQQQVRQGDVLLHPVESIPAAVVEEAREGGRVVLAYGEVTGHSHAIAEPGAAILSTADGERFLRLVGAADLVHEEHARIRVAPGVALIVIHREWTDSMAAVPVID